MQENIVEGVPERARVERAARLANSVQTWDKLWSHEGRETWRGEFLEQVYARIAQLMPRGAKVIDIGGGVGLLGSKLKNDCECDVEVWDHSEAALVHAVDAGLGKRVVDLEAIDLGIRAHEFEGRVFVSTETLEHLSDMARNRIVASAAASGKPAFFSIPNNALGPDEEPQHTIKWTALDFLTYLRGFFGHNDARVECIGGYLLGVCGIPKKFTMSLTLPVRDEGKDLERVLASFRSCSDEMVIGIDPRTTDDTFEVASRYAEKVFYLEELLGPPGEEVPEGGIHFAHARNQCMNRCTSDWVFMTEGHEHLMTGQDELLNLDRLPEAARVAFVLRTGNQQQWGFPWLCRNAPDLRYKRSTHNVLDYPEGTFVIQLARVKTLHTRDHVRERARKDQRKIQNRLTLMDDWLTNVNEMSLYYLAGEWREHSSAKAIDRYREFLEVCRGRGAMRYQARLILGKMLMERNRPGDLADCRTILMEAVADDWTRTEHWIWLGDLAMNQERHEEAYRFYHYGASRLKDPPFTILWIDLPYYSYLPAQRLAMASALLGKREEALAWAARVIELAPEDAPEEFLEEARNNVKVIEESMGSMES